MCNESKSWQQKKKITPKRKSTKINITWNTPNFTYKYRSLRLASGGVIQ